MLSSKSFRAGHAKHGLVAETTIEYLSMDVVLYLASRPVAATAQYGREQQ